MPGIRAYGGTVNEGGNLTFTIQLTSSSTETISVDYRALPGTTFNTGEFYNTYGSSVTFVPGETLKTISVNTNGDYIAEADEAVQLELYNPVNADFGEGLATLTATGWMDDDDNPGTTRAMQVTGDKISEADGNGRTAAFHINFSEAFTTDVTLAYATKDGTATAGSDYTATSGSLTLYAGQTEATVNVALLGDKVSEGAEDFYLVVTPPAGLANFPMTATGRTQILDDDDRAGPSITVDGTSTIEGGNLYYNVVLSEASTDAVTVRYRTVSTTGAGTADANEFYPLGSGSNTLTFLPGETSASISVNTNGDYVSETDETIVLELYEPTNAALSGGKDTLRATGWVLDDDNVGNTRALFVSGPVVSERRLEGKSEAVFDIDLSRPSRQAISINYETINGTAKQGQDFVGTSGTLVLAPGQTHASVSVAIKADLAREQSETFSLRLIPPFSSDIATNTIGVIGTATIDDSSIVGTSGGDSLQGTKAADAMFGDGGDDFLFGLNGNDVLFGGGGNDTIDGGKGRDSMRGGGGNDRYTIDRSSDRIVEAHNAGTDTVSSPVDFTLPKNVENLILTGSKDLAGIGNDLGNKLTGNKGDNRLEGLAGNDTLNGGKGRDTMIGGPGNDTYVLDTRGDHIVEQAGGGTDTVKVSFDYTLANRFENLTLLGKGRLDGNGNAADNVIHGNRGANELKGLDGDDRLIGGGGNDRMIGGSGNDTYVVDGKGDRVIETGGGHDRIETSVDFRLPGHVEDITAIGRKGIDITGNSDANRLTGNRGANLLDGGKGADKMAGGNGNDTYIVDSGRDQIKESAHGGTDTVKSAVSYKLSGNLETPGPHRAGGSLRHRQRPSQPADRQRREQPPRRRRRQRRAEGRCRQRPPDRWQGRRHHERRRRTRHLRVPQQGRGRRRPHHRLQAQDRPDRPQRFRRQQPRARHAELQAGRLLHRARRAAPRRLLRQRAGRHRRRRLRRLHHHPRQHLRDARPWGLHPVIG